MMITEQDNVQVEMTREHDRTEAELECTDTDSISDITHRSKGQGTTTLREADDQGRQDSTRPFQTFPTGPRGKSMTMYRL